MEGEEEKKEAKDMEAGTAEDGTLASTAHLSPNKRPRETNNTDRRIGPPRPLFEK